MNQEHRLLQSLGMELLPDVQQVMQQAQILEWALNPLQLVEGIEVLKRLEINDPYYRNSTDLYMKRIRPQILASLMAQARRLETTERLVSFPYIDQQNQPNFSIDYCHPIVIVGTSSSAKGTVGSGLYKLITEDEIIKHMSNKFQVPVRPVLFHYASCIEVAKLEGLIPYTPDHVKYSTQDYANGSLMQWRLYQEWKQDIVTQNGVFIPFFEASAPACFPINGTYPIQVEGESDRGISNIGNLLTDPANKDTSANTTVIVLDAEEAVTKSGAKHRSHFNLQSPDYQGAFHGRNRIMLLVNGEYVDITTCPLEDQISALRVVKKLSAPPATIERGWQQFSTYRQKLYQEGKISAPTVEGYARGLQRVFNASDLQFVVAKNNFFDDADRVLILDYLQKANIALQRYPYLLEERTV